MIHATSREDERDYSERHPGARAHVEYDTADRELAQELREVLTLLEETS